MYKTDMITMLSNSLSQQHNVNRLTCHITMKVVSEDSSCSMVGLGARAACAEVSTGSLGDLKAKLHLAKRFKGTLKVHMDPGIYGR
jgi:hypothetical protein